MASSATCSVRAIAVCCREVEGGGADSATVAPVAVTTSAAAAVVGSTKLELNARGRRARRDRTR